MEIKCPNCSSPIVLSYYTPGEVRTCNVCGDAFQIGKPNHTASQANTRAQRILEERAKDDAWVQSILATVIAPFKAIGQWFRSATKKQPPVRPNAVEATPTDSQSPRQCPVCKAAWHLGATRCAQCNWDAEQQRHVVTSPNESPIPSAPTRPEVAPSPYMPPWQPAPVRRPVTPTKNSGVAAVLSFLFPLWCVGQIYNDQFGKVLFIWALGGMGFFFGLVTFGLGFLLVIPFQIVLWVYTAYDAYSSAERINREGPYPYGGQLIMCAVFLGLLFFVGFTALFLWNPSAQPTSTPEITASKPIEESADDIQLVNEVPDKPEAPPMPLMKTWENAYWKFNIEFPADWNVREGEQRAPFLANASRGCRGGWFFCDGRWESQRLIGTRVSPANSGHPAGENKGF